MILEYKDKYGVWIHPDSFKAIPKIVRDSIAQNMNITKSEKLVI
jgi:hypothetical protein